MTEVLRNRGPDGSGTWVDEKQGIAFGHRRLAIIDLTRAGEQPMTAASGRYVITFNGEIFNHVELRTELGRNRPRFRGHSDTETLLACIDAWGLDHTLGRIDGMFAFGLWDREERSLTLGRDPLGERPLYVGDLGNGDLVFASTLDAIRAHPDFDLDVDVDALADYFAYKYVPAPKSIFSGVSKLEPGSIMKVVAATGHVSTRRYWSLLDVIADTTPFHGDDADAVDAVEAALATSVRRRLRADVPTGAFMSGGIDSSTVVALAARFSTEPLRTFTIGSSSADLDETGWAHDVASIFGTRHTEMVVSGEDARAALLDAPTVHDEPFGDSSNIAMTLVSRLAREDVTVALTGDGGDEIFGGYNRYRWLPRIWRGAQLVPPAVRRSVDRHGPGLAIRTDRAAALVPRRIRPPLLDTKLAKAFRGLGADSPASLYDSVCEHWSEPPLTTAFRRGSRLSEIAAPDDLRLCFAERMMVADTLGLLPDEILTKADRAGMSVGLETRTPFASRDVVELAWSLPLETKIRSAQSKWPLRQILGRSLPPSIINRPKAGFGLPIDTWLRGPLRSWADELLHDRTTLGIIDHGRVDRMWTRHLDGRCNAAYELWDVLMLADWCRRRDITLN